jgi:hypothetical protein
MAEKFKYEVKAKQNRLMFSEYLLCGLQCRNPLYEQGPCYQVSDRFLGVQAKKISCVPLA